MPTVSSSCRRTPFEAAALSFLLVLGGCGGGYGAQPAYVPNAFKGESVVQLVSAGGDLLMVLLADGTVKFGMKQEGAAAELSELRGATTLVNGGLCAIFADASLRCVGRGTVASGVLEATHGYQQMCFIRTDHSAACVDDAGRELVEVPLGGRHALHIDGSWTKVCVVADDSSLHCWKRELNPWPATSAPKSPLPGSAIANLPQSGIAQVSVHGRMTLDTNGGVLFGDFEQPKTQKPMGDSESRQLLKGMIAVANSCALSADGNAHCFRSHVYGQQMNASDLTNTGVETMVVPDVSQLVSITENECGLRANGQVVCWGNIVRPAKEQTSPRRPPILSWPE